MAMSYKFNLSTYVQEPLVMTGLCTVRDLNGGKLLAADSGRCQSSQKAVAYESELSKGIR